MHMLYNRPFSFLSHTSRLVNWLGNLHGSYWVVLPCVAVHCAQCKGGSNFCVCEWNPSVTTQMKATELYFPVVLFIMLCKVVLTFESVYQIPMRDHSIESYWAVLNCGAVYCHLLTVNIIMTVTSRIINSLIVSSFKICGDEWAAIDWCSTKLPSLFINSSTSATIADFLLYFWTKLFFAVKIVCRTIKKAGNSIIDIKLCFF